MYNIRSHDMPRKAKKRAPKVEKFDPLEAEHHFLIARLFMIDNLPFMKYIGYKFKPETIAAHNRAVQDYGMPKIDPVGLEYVKKDDPRWQKL